MTGHRQDLAEAGIRLAVAVERQWGGPVGPAELWAEFHGAAAVAEAAARAIDPESVAAARFADLADLAESVAAAIDEAAR